MLLEKRTDVRLYIGNGVTLNVFPDDLSGDFMVEAVWNVEDCLYRSFILCIPMGEFTEEEWQKEVVTAIKTLFETGEILPFLNFTKEDGVEIEGPFEIQKVSVVETKLFHAVDLSLSFEASLWDKKCYVDYRTSIEDCPICFLVDVFEHVPGDKEENARISLGISDAICDGYFTELQKDFPQLTKSPVVKLFELYGASIEACEEFAKEQLVPELLHEIGTLKGLASALETFGFTIPYVDAYSEMEHLADALLSEEE